MQKEQCTASSISQDIIGHLLYLGLLKVNWLTGYPVPKGWTGYKINGPLNCSALALVVRLWQQVCRHQSNKRYPCSHAHTHTYWTIQPPTNYRWTPVYGCGFLSPTSRQSNRRGEWPWHHWFWGLVLDA